MVNLINMPVIEGMIGLFDYNNLDKKKNIWKNQLNNNFFIDFLLKSQYFNHAPPFEQYEALLFGGSGGINYKEGKLCWPYFQGSVSLENFSIYLLIKQIAGQGSDPIFVLRAPVDQYSNKDIDISYYNRCWRFYIHDVGSITTSANVSDYHVLTITKNQEEQKVFLYVDGEKIYTAKNVEDRIYTKFFNTYTHHYNYSTASATRSNAGAVLYKCICISKVCHTEGDVFKNSDWLLTQYGIRNSQIKLAQETEEMSIAKTLVRHRTTQNLIFDSENAFLLGAKKKKEAEEEIEDDPEDGEITEEGEEPIDGEGITIIPPGTDEPPDGDIIIGNGDGNELLLEDGSSLTLRHELFDKAVVVASSGNLFLGGLAGTSTGEYLCIDHISKEGKLLNTVNLGPIWANTFGPESAGVSILGDSYASGWMLWSEITEFSIQVTNWSITLKTKYKQFAADYQVRILEPPLEFERSSSYSPPGKIVRKVK